jgi:anti-sigma B factor antagonist
MEGTLRVGVNRMPRPEHIPLHHERDGTRHALSAEGELDLLSAAGLEAAVVRLCAEGAQEIVVDLHRVDFVDSAGIRALVVSRRHCEERGCDFSLARVQPPARRLFEVTGLAGRLAARGHSRHARAGSGSGAAKPLAARRPDLDLPLELNLDAPRSARNYVRDLLRSHPSRALRETAMLLTSDLVTPLVARPPATFLENGELRVWLHGDTVRVELLVPHAALDGEAGSVYDVGLFSRLGAQVAIDETDEGARAAFELDGALEDVRDHGAEAGARSDPAAGGT